MKRTFERQVFLNTTACFFLLLIGCGDDDAADTIDSGPADTDTDTDIDADTDTDGDSDVNRPGISGDSVS